MADNSYDDIFDNLSSTEQTELFNGTLFGEQAPEFTPARPAKRGKSKSGKKLPNFDRRQWVAIQAMADAVDSKDTLRPGEKGVDKAADPLNGNGRVVVRVEAVAGSGKSSCIMGAIGEMSRVTGLLLTTHGKKIQTDLKKRLKTYHPELEVNNVPIIDTRTINSLGNSLLNRSFDLPGAKAAGAKPQPGEVVATGKLLPDFRSGGLPDGKRWKYRDIVRGLAQRPSLIEVLGLDDRGNVKTAGLLKLVEFCRIRLLPNPTPETIESLAYELGLEFKAPQQHDRSPSPFTGKWERLATAVQEAHQLGIEDLSKPIHYPCKDGHVDVYAGLIDGTDQMWIPFLMGASAPSNWKFRAVVIDEYQDLNPLQLWTIEQYLHDDSPIVFVGDKRQAIFGFMGAGRNTFDLIETKYPAKVIELTDSYRCPESHLAIARHFHPSIRRAAAAGPDAPGSNPQLLGSDEMFSTLQKGDVVLGRSTAALVAAGLRYVVETGIDSRTGKPNGCRITVPELNGQLNLLIDDVSRLWKKKTGAARMNFQRDFREALSNAREECPPGKSDGFDLLNVLFEYAHDREFGQTRSAFCNFVTKLVSSETEEVVSRTLVNFRTVHSFKGMEAPRVFVVALGLTSNYWTEKLSPQQLQEEKNLSYVALTRSTRELYLVPDFHRASMQDIGELFRNPVPRPEG
jgi:superfamily I DNA/RNA helicase